MAAGSGGGGGGFEIAKAFVTIEARLKQDSFDAAKRAAQQKLSGPGGPGPASPPPPSGGGGTPPPPPRTPAGPAPSGGAGATPQMGGLASQVAQAVSDGFRRALSTLTQRGPQQPTQNVVQRPLANPQPVVQPQMRQPVVQGQAQRQNFPSADEIANRVAARINPRMATAAAPELSAGRGGAGGTTVNNYNTQVRIDPRKIDELLNAIRTVNQLRARNRARPSEAPTFESRRSGAGSQRQEVTKGTLSAEQKAQINALAQNATLLNRLRAGASSLGSLGLGWLERFGGKSLIEGLNIDSEKRTREWREERRTRYKPKGKKRSDADPTAPSGFRKRGQFYFNNKFRGANYRDFRTTNASSIAASIERQVEQRAAGREIVGGDGNTAALRIQDRFRKSKAARRGTLSGAPSFSKKKTQKRPPKRQRQLRRQQSRRTARMSRGRR